MKDLLNQVSILTQQAEHSAAENILDLRCGKPFESSRIKTLSQISQAILQDEMLRQDASCVALGYWLRKSNLQKMKALSEKLENVEPEIVFAPVGRVFHVAPANVDTLFVYSWALSYLCGNANVVRLSTHTSPVVERLIAILSRQMKRDRVLLNGNLFLTYSHDDWVSEELSRWCDHRVIWGGDETVRRFRAIPLNPHASERVFGSKFSYALLSAEAWEKTTKKEKDQLCSQFFNDAFWFGQMACSSPHILFWKGDEKTFALAVEQFDEQVAKELSKRSYAGDAGSSMKMLGMAFKLAAECKAQVNLAHFRFVSVKQNFTKELDREVCGGGFFRHVRVNQWNEAASFSGQQDQTVTHFGIPSSELKQLALVMGSRGVDRFVPIGQALDFDLTWDGYHLLQDFMRRIRVRNG